MSENLIDSEKAIERALVLKIKNIKGWSLKLLATHVTGLPDRICLLPRGQVFFVEVKTTKQKPKKIQITVHNKLKELGFEVYVIDRLADVDRLISAYA